MEYSSSPSATAQTLQHALFRPAAHRRDTLLPGRVVVCYFGDCEVTRRGGQWSLVIASTAVARHALAIERQDATPTMQRGVCGTWISCATRRRRFCTVRTLCRTMNTSGEHIGRYGRRRKRPNCGCSAGSSGLWSPNTRLKTFSPSLFSPELWTSQIGTGLRAYKRELHALYRSIMARTFAPSASRAKGFVSMSMPRSRKSAR